MKFLNEVLIDGKWAKKITPIIGRPGSLGFCLARDTVSVIFLRAGSMGLSFLISVFLAHFILVEVRSL